MRLAEGWKGNRTLVRHYKAGQLVEAMTRDVWDRMLLIGCRRLTNPTSPEPLPDPNTSPEPKIDH